jgi:hypothetical protein
MAPEPLQPHETAAFQNSAKYVVAVTFTLAGGARRRTAERRAERIAERLASTAARAAGVVDVSAVTGPTSSDGTMLVPRRVHFSAANTGHATYGDPGKLDRYLDPEHERALASLAAANEAYRARQNADRKRRQAVGCVNAHRVGLPGDRRSCECVYCRPDDHLAARELDASGSHWFTPPACLCGTPTPAGGRCMHHRRVEVVVIDGDPDALRQLAEASRRGER